MESFESSASSLTPSDSAPLRNGYHVNDSSLKCLSPRNEKEKYARSLDAIENIRNKIGSKSLPLPQICVIGNQSSGKSTLLSKLVPGLQYVLPQGRGTTTRCPIIIRMKSIQDASTRQFIKINESEFEWNRDGQLAAQRKISELQKQLALKTQDVDMECSMVDEEEDEADDAASFEDDAEIDVGFSSEEIRLTVHHHDVNDLELVDLPGLISNAEGKSIEVVNQMARKAIENPMSFILVVHVANDDIKLAPAFKMAKDVDPEASRTLIVFTKCDNFGTDQAKEDFIGLMKKYPRKYFGVSCSKGTDKDGLVISGPSEDEDCDKYGFSDLFPKNYGFRNLFDNRLPPLLNEILKRNIPLLSEEIQSKIRETESVLEEIGENDPRSDDIIQEVTTQILEKNDDIENSISELTVGIMNQLDKLKDNEINLKNIMNKVKPSCFTPSRFQGSREFKSCINDICTKMIPFAEIYFEESIKVLTSIINGIATDKRIVHSGLVNCWVKFKKILQDNLRDEIKRLEKETKIFLPINSISEESQSASAASAASAASSHEDPKIKIGRDLFNLFRKYYADMTKTFVNRVFVIANVVIRDPFTKEFVWGLKSNEEFQEKCVDDPETVEKRSEAKTLREALNQCQAELDNI